MARQTLEEQMLALLNKAKASNSAPAPNRVKARDISKALAMFKKSQNFLTQAISLLEGDDVANNSPKHQENVAKYPTAPYGRKADGTPKMASGKQAQTVEANSFRKEYPELFGTTGERVGNGKNRGATGSKK
ncbi:hypothetical protein PK28_08580 [Hymenobacter sp. DG25B]|uniref:hypothetical protein n=1 Tax=Hymenobacter sp. DG25B TaxID=1385664 RepID=UPI0005409E25|nr:hypothetical protein [Hymenobacter sp. DG25B]AIZ63737.1 hypothetical protein PK28_08580 [Hymenobacter sp. DG25B]